MLRFLIVIIFFHALSPVIFASEVMVLPANKLLAYDYPGTLSQSSRFLNQATFGSSIEEIKRLRLIGYSSWISEQVAAPISLQRPAIEGVVRIEQEDFTRERMAIWWQHALYAPDQLRQRVAFALSEILVVSDNNDLTYEQPLGMAEYYDNLARGAFGNFRTILEDVSTSPVMGLYLSHLQNQQADPANNIRPDENYAREILQLFSIGLWHLNMDGSPMLDGQGDPIPTYDQAVVEEFARVFTGWNFSGVQEWDYYPWEEFVYLPMEPYNNIQDWERVEGYHDRGQKQLLAYPLNGVESDQWPRAILPALQGAEDAQTDLTRALDNIFNHPSIAPFISRQLIQRLVTSNPSPEYIGRVSAVFADNGNGVRGDMESIIRAILLDREARFGHITRDEVFGKLREPLLRLTQVWRAFEAAPPKGNMVPEFYPKYWFAQAPMRSPSVFNFFSPDYRPPGEIAEAGMVAPEFQITNETYVNRTANIMLYSLFDGYSGAPDASAESMVLNFDQELSLAAYPQKLVSHLDLLFMSRQMSREMRSELVAVIELLGMDDLLEGSSQRGLLRVLVAVYLVITSPEYVVQR